MSDIVFVHPTCCYDSYTDYRRLVSVSGFETCNQDQINPNRDAIYIVSPMNGDVENALRARPKASRKCKIVSWFLERPSPHGGVKFNEHVVRLISDLVDEFWVSDRAMYQAIKGIVNTKFVPVGGDEAIGGKRLNDKTFDVTHMSYVYGRRDKIIHSLRCRIGPNGWGDARHNTLLRTKMMVNVHQDNDGYYEPLRFALCAAYAMPMISEQCLDPYPYEAGVDFLSAPYDQLNSLIDRAINGHIGDLQNYGERMFHKVTKQFKFVDNVKRALT